jgi:hypothetical protein
MTSIATAVPWQEDLTSSARRISAVTVAGLVSGAVIGGVGGRVAMLLLRLTSSDALHGLESDDGFVMGQVSGASLFLILFTGVLGVLGALFYVAVRGWFPFGSRAVLAGIFGAAVGGAGVVHPDGLDFRLLEPLWLAVALFVALPALYGVAMSVLVERALRRDAEGALAGGRLWFLGLIPFIALGLFGPPGILILLLVGGVWWVHRSVPGFAALWQAPVVVWIGRALLLALTAWSFAALLRDVRQIL